MTVSRLSWQAQTLVSLALGLLMGWLLTPWPPAAVLPPAQVRLVELRFMPDSAPQFINVHVSNLAPVLTPTPAPRSSSNAVLEVRDAQGKSLWRLPFTVSFVIEDLSSPASYRLLSFVIPALPREALLYVSGPGGEASYALP